VPVIGGQTAASPWHRSWRYLASTSPTAIRDLFARKQSSTPTHAVLTTCPGSIRRDRSSALHAAGAASNDCGKVSSSRLRLADRSGPASRCRPQESGP
jgi:hypothetical protein